jgi:hypothetical protein
LSTGAVVPLTGPKTVSQKVPQEVWVVVPHIPHARWVTDPLTWTGAIAVPPGVSAELNRLPKVISPRLGTALIDVVSYATVPKALGTVDPKLAPSTLVMLTGRPGFDGGCSAPGFSTTFAFPAGRSAACTSSTETATITTQITTKYRFAMAYSSRKHPLSVDPVSTVVTSTARHPTVAPLASVKEKSTFCSLVDRTEAGVDEKLETIAGHHQLGLRQHLIRHFDH